MGVPTALFIRNDRLFFYLVGENIVYSLALD